MAGHSKYKNIMHRKGRADSVRSKLFSKLSREITVAAKMGLPDPDANARLRAAIRDAAPMTAIRAAADAHRVFVTVESIVLDPVSTLPRDLRLNIASVARRAVKEANSDKPDLDFLAAIAEDFAAGLGARQRTDR